jgi:hypothetical protein
MPDRPGLAGPVVAISIQLVDPIQGVIQAMSIKRPGIAAAVLVGMGTTWMGWAAGQSLGDAQGTKATPSGSDAAQVPGTAVGIYQYVKLRPPDELNWQRIPWLTDLPEAIRQARAEDRPILLWVAGDDPLDRC